MSPTTKYLGMYAAYVGALHLMDGPWRHWSKGRVVDPWTLTHVAWSVLGQRMGLPLKTVMGLTVANEIIEAALRRQRPDLLFGTPEGAANVAADIAANYVGYIAAQRLTQ